MNFVYLFSVQATFKITLDVPSNLIALSNMPVIEEKKEGDLKTVYFEESPIMSTYLVAVVVGLFDFVESSTSDGIPGILLVVLLFFNELRLRGSLYMTTFLSYCAGIKVRCYCQVGKSDQGKFALEVAVKTLELYKK